MYKTQITCVLISLIRIEKTTGDYLTNTNILSETIQITEK